MVFCLPIALMKRTNGLAEHREMECRDVEMGMGFSCSAHEFIISAIASQMFNVSKWVCFMLLRINTKEEINSH